MPESPGSGIPHFRETLMSNTKPFTCIDCGVAGEQGRRGARRLRCDDCRAERMKAHHAGTLVRRCPTCSDDRVDKGRTYCSEACAPKRTWAERKAGRSRATCEACGAEYAKCRPAQRWCSMACGNRHKAGAGPRGGLSPEARERQRLYWQEKNRRRRAAKRGGASEPYTLAEIAVRDRMRCGLCGRRVPMDRKVPNPLAPTIDHVLPISEGGDDTRANVQLAHFRCNNVKGARGCQQLALIG